MIPLILSGSYKYSELLGSVSGHCSGDAEVFFTPNKFEVHLTKQDIPCVFSEGSDIEVSAFSRWPKTNTSGLSLNRILVKYLLVNHF